MSESPKNRILNILAVGMDPAILSDLEKTISPVGFLSVVCHPDSLLEPSPVSPDIVLCAAPPPGVSVVEIAQLLRMNYSATPVFLVFDRNGRGDRKDLTKNGFSDVFFLPLERNLLFKTVSEVADKIRDRGRIFRPVKIVDIEPGNTLDFDTFIYLPANCKHVRFTSAGDDVDQDRAERLRKHQVATLLINEGDMPKFYAFTAERLRALGSSTAISETERAARMQTAVRDLISGMFSESSTGTESGKKIVEDCRNIVRAYVTADGGKDWYTRLLAAMSSGEDSYSHAGETSTYAALFGMAAGLKSVEELAMAGLIHDIGLSRVPQETLAKDPLQWTPADREEYGKHPEYAIQMIQERKLVLSEIVHKIVLQHHEEFSGRGFPRGLSGTRICEEAQVLALADRFADGMELKVGLPRPDPRLIIAGIGEAIRNDPANAFIDPKLFAKIAGLFTSSASAPVAA